ncbi:histidinol-phosphate transaminase [Oleidesulfovibrio alaskensis]|jgi:histidinol-phosphate aminotransferase|uniref:histidinol-phosphate transaminase n=1 Tax=Oleidesulfovibrio alaskensis TaxID=58180 RepID=UPI0003FC5F32|nr:histidinol-phosphate transaminase [Oleidesulfovibrio alaskensis]
MTEPAKREDSGLPEAVTAIRPEVAAFKPYAPGLSIDEIKERYGLSQVVKMASNENPLGTSPLVQQTLRTHADLAFRYVQSGNPRLVSAIARSFGVAAESVVTGNGSDEVIDLIIRVKARPGKHNIVAFNPCFSMYELQTRFCGVEFRQVPLRADFSFDYDAFVGAADADTAVAFITTPDNPSGYCPPVEEIIDLARRLPSSCLLVVDEAYMDFADDPAAHSVLPHLTEFPNVAVLRTFSKSYGLAGLRLGFGVMHPALADYVKRVRLPFSINILAEYAGIAALQDTTFHAQTLRVTREGRTYLTGALTGAGCTVYPSAANFIMFALPENCPHDARAVFEALLRRGIIIRPLSSYNLPQCLRVSIGNRHENELFIAQFKELLRG